MYIWRLLCLWGKGERGQGQGEGTPTCPLPSLPCLTPFCLLFHAISSSLHTSLSLLSILYTPAHTLPTVSLLISLSLHVSSLTATATSHLPYYTHTHSIYSPSMSPLHATHIFSSLDTGFWPLAYYLSYSLPHSHLLHTTTGLPTTSTLLFTHALPHKHYGLHYITCGCL